MLGLVLAVMVEKQRGPKSRCGNPYPCLFVVLRQIGPSHAADTFLCLCRWQGYLGFLPDSLPGMPIYWKPSALSYLKGTAPWEKLTGTKAMPGCYVEPPFDVRPVLLQRVYYKQACSSLAVQSMQRQTTKEQACAGAGLL